MNEIPIAVFMCEIPTMPISEIVSRLNKQTTQKIRREENGLYTLYRGEYVYMTNLNEETVRGIAIGVFSCC